MKRIQLKIDVTDTKRWVDVKGPKFFTIQCWDGSPVSHVSKNNQNLSIEPRQKKPNGLL